MRRRSIHSVASWISQRLMHEAMNTRKTSSGIVFSVFAEKKSNTSAALRVGIPVDLAPCDGRLLQIMEYTALFSIIGQNFGGDGQKTFALPNYQGLAPKGSQYFIALNGVFPQRS